MAKSKSFFGLRRGSTKSHTYQVNYGQQITKDRVSSVRNPRTVAQAMQRMKINNARLFYNANNSASARGFINHSFESVAYNDPTRRAFMSEAMKKVGGPYIPKGTGQWIPGDYIVAKGSLPVPDITISNVVPTAGEGQTLTTIQSGDVLTAENVATFQALGIPAGAQISIVEVQKDGSLYTPIAYEFLNKAGEEILDSDTGWMLYILTTTATGEIVSATLNVGLYAGCIIISQQDAGGKWLRSPARYWIGDDIREAYYTPAALQAAVLSYQIDYNENALNSPYFLNQAGAERAYDGSVVAITVEDKSTHVKSTFLAGMIILDGRIYYQLISTTGTMSGYLVGTDGNALAIVAGDIDNDAYDGLDGFNLPTISMAPQVVEYNEGMLEQGGF